MDEDVAAQFLRLACLTYVDDDPERPARARALLAEQPAIARSSLWAAAAAGDPDAVEAFTATSDAAASAAGGPHDWKPLLYLCYSRAGGARAVEAARILLAHGADPNAGFLCQGLLPPFTALTGAFGGGEGGNRQPPHPQSLELARLLLEAGADPNDDQTLYNRHFQDDDSHLELLFAHGLGGETDGPWQRRYGNRIGTPREMLEDQLMFAAAKGHAARVELLLRHGVDPAGRGRRHPIHRGRSPIELALANGNADVVAALLGAGVAMPEQSPLDALVHALLAGSRADVEALRTREPDLVARTRERHPHLIARAAGLRRPQAVRLIAELGFDVNALGRATALHEAAWAGDAELAELLLSLGADRALRDREHQATPADWASHNGHLALAERLAAVEAS